MKFGGNCKRFKAVHHYQINVLKKEKYKLDTILSIVAKVTFFVCAQQTLTTHRKPYNKEQLSRLLFKCNKRNKVFFSWRCSQINNF